MKPFYIAVALHLALVGHGFGQTRPADSRPASTKPAPIRVLETGSPMPDFDLPGVDGRRYSPKDFADAKILVIVFTCTHCPTAQAYQGRIKQLAKDYKEKGVALVAISPNDPLAVRLDELGYTDLGDSFEEMKIRAKEEGFEFPFLYDGETQDVSRAVGPAATPTVLIFDRERKLRYMGRVDDSEKENRVKSKDTRNALDAMLAGKPVPVAQTRSFGCSIKWSDKRESVVETMKALAKEPVSLEMMNRAGIEKIIANKSDKIRLVNVWATWCAPCVIEFPELVTMNRMYRQRGFEFVSISANDVEDKDKVLAFLKKKEASNQNVLFSGDSKDELGDAISKEWSGAMPLTLLIAPGGKVIYKKEGPIDALELRRQIVDQIGRSF